MQNDNNVKILLTCDKVTLYQVKDLQQPHNNHKTKIAEVNLCAFVSRLFHEYLTPIIGTNIQYCTGLYVCFDDRREIFMKQSVNKCR